MNFKTFLVVQNKLRAAAETAKGTQLLVFDIRTTYEESLEYLQTAKTKPRKTSSELEMTVLK